MKSMNIPTNARNGTVAEDIVRTFLKRDLRPGGTAHEHGYRQFEVEGWTRPGPDLPDDKVALVEVTTRRPLPTYMVLVSLFTSQEVGE